MAKVQFKNREVEFMAEGGDALVMAALDKLKRRDSEAKETVLATPKQQPKGMEWDVVAIYDEAGIPSIMHRFRRVTNKELFGGSDTPHPAFVIGGEVYDEIYISVYQNCEINGKPYSLPHMKPWTGITLDEAEKACFAKGEGWHLLTGAEWGLLANISAANGTLPHGNTSCGKYHGDESEKGETYDGYRTLTGTGPKTWTHNHQVDGVHDLCGNVWEWLRGIRVKDGRLEAAKNNDGAAPIDLSEGSGAWHSVTDDNGADISFDCEDGIRICTDDPDEHEGNYSGNRWADVETDCVSEELKALGFWPGDPENYLFIDSTEGEWAFYAGGYYSVGSFAGVFYLSGSNARSYSSAFIGFRSAYFVKAAH